MPDDADSAVAGIAAPSSARLIAARWLADHRFRRAEGFADGGQDRVELVVAGQLLDDRSAVVLEDHEVPDEREEAPMLADTGEQHLHFGQG